VVGVLVEKELTTPDAYPLSLNALAAGCNQKSNRNPPMSLSEAELRVLLDGLRMKGLVGASHPSGGRVERYHHSAREVWSVGGAALALLTELLLRGPQTPGELRTRAGRMHAMETKDTVLAELTGLEARGMVKSLPPEPGSRARRYMECLTKGAKPVPAAPRVEPSAREDSPAATPGGTPADLGGRVAALEAEVGELRARLERLERPLPGPD